MTQKNGGNKTGAKVGVGLGLAAAAIAGAFYLYGKEGAKRRAKIRGWALKAKGEVLEKLENLKDVNEETYNKVVDTVAEKYKKAKGVDLAEVTALVADMKRHWGNIRRQMNPPKKAPARKKPAAKKAAPKQNGSGS